MNEFYEIIREKKKYDRTWILAWVLMVGALAVSLHPSYYTGKGKAIFLIVITSMEFFRKYIFFFYEKRVILGGNLPGKDDADIYNVMRYHAFDADAYINMLLKKLMKVTGITFVGMLIYSLFMYYRYGQFPVTFVLMSLFVVVTPLIVAAGYKNEARIRFRGRNQTIRKRVGVVGNIFYILIKFAALYGGTISLIEYLMDKLRSIVILKGFSTKEYLVFNDEEIDHIVVYFLMGWTIFFIAKNLYLGVRRIMLGLALVCFVAGIVTDVGNNMVYDGKSIYITENYKTHKYDIDDILSYKKSYNSSRDTWYISLSFSDGRKERLASYQVINKTCIDALVENYYELRCDYKFKKSKTTMKKYVDNMNNKGDKND